jgi:hypothetical protein
MKKIIFIGIILFNMISYANQVPLAYNVKKESHKNSITISFKLYDREKNDLEVYLIDTKDDNLYKKENDFIRGDIGKIETKKNYQIIINNRTIQDLSPVILVYDGEALGSEMIEFLKTKKTTTFISSYETMNIQFCEFVDIGGYSDENYWHITDKVITLDTLAWKYNTDYQWTNPRYWNLSDDPYWKNDRSSNKKGTPVIGVSWWEIMAYIKWIDGEIITRNDWAKLVIKKDIFPKKEFYFIKLNETEKPKFKDANLRFSNSKYKYKGFNDDGSKYTSVVGSYPPIIYNGKKIYDLVGNIYEWTADVVKVIQYPKFTCADRYIIGGSYKAAIEQMNYPVIGLCPLYRTDGIGFRYKVEIPKKRLEVGG